MAAHKAEFSRPVFAKKGLVSVFLKVRFLSAYAIMSLCD
ncbi:unnamed protein product [Fructobacillus cardui]|nr:unnamed protein product [Fructobacillus cardui]